MGSGLPLLLVSVDTSPLCRWSEAERVEVGGKGTLIMPHTHKGKAIEHKEPVDELPK